MQFDEYGYYIPTELENKATVTNAELAAYHTGKAIDAVVTPVALGTMIVGAPLAFMGIGAALRRAMGSGKNLAANTARGATGRKVGP